MVWKNGLADYKNHYPRDNKSIIRGAKAYAKPYFYVFGGLQNVHTMVTSNFLPFVTNEIVRYDIERNEWTVVGHIKYKRYDHRRELKSRLILPNEWFSQFFSAL